MDNSQRHLAHGLDKGTQSGRRTRRETLKLIAAAATGGLVAQTSAANGAVAPGASDQVPVAQRADGRVSVGASSEFFVASDPRLPNGGVQSSNTGPQNDAALDELFSRVRASAASRKYVQMPAGTLQFAASISPSGRTPGRGQRADFLPIDFPNTRIVAAGDSVNYTPIQLCAEDGRFFDMDHFNNTRPQQQQVPWSKSLDTVWINNDENGTLRHQEPSAACVAGHERPHV